MPSMTKMPAPTAMPAVTAGVIPGREVCSVVGGTGGNVVDDSVVDGSEAFVVEWP